MGCGCNKGKKRTVKYVVNYSGGGSTTFGSLREAQEDLQARNGQGRISKVRE